MTAAHATISPRSGDELPAALETYLRDQLRLSGNYQVQQFPGGFSNLTYLISFGEQKVVLRRPPRGSKAKSAHDMGREYYVLEHLREHFPACPAPLHFCQDETLLGSSFYVMTYLDGLILRAELPRGLELSPEQQQQQIKQLIALQAQLHGLDFAALGLAEFGQARAYRDRQISGWSKRYRAARTDDAPDFEEVMAWLEGHKPQVAAEAERASLIHNDFKLDNVVFDRHDPSRIIGVLDWEMATIGDPLMDLGNSLAYWIEAGDPEYMQAIRTLPSHLPAYPGRRQQLAWYQELSGCSIQDWAFYYTAGLFRLAVIAQQIYGRYRQGFSSDPRFAQLIHGVKGLERACKLALESQLA